MVLPSHPDSSNLAKKPTSTPPQNLIISALTLIIFTFFDFLDGLFGIILSYLDDILERDNSSSSSPCNSICYRRRDEYDNIDDGNGKSRRDEDEKINYGNEKSREEEDDEMLLSETLYRRKNYFRDYSIGVSKKLKLNRKGEGELIWRTEKEGGFGIRNKRRWSDCGCERCISWMKKGDSFDGSDLKLHVVVQGPCQTGRWSSIENTTTNPHMDHVVFLHGFLSSSSFWTQTVFPNLSSSANRKFRSFAVDLLGFGSSPKPNDCLYTLKDHVEMIEKSVIEPYRRCDQLDNNNSDSFGFHLVAHSMGCIIALAVAAKDPNSVRSLTLIAPPFVPSGDGGDASTLALHKLAGKRLWPPLLFGASFMSWYEHLGRVVCFLFCRNHRIWEFILKILTLKRDLPFMILDLTRHTHHSAWHTMHNVICGGAKLTDKYLEILKQSNAKVTVIQGDHDQVVPLECSYYIKTKLPEADVKIVPNTDHSNVILSRPKEFTRDLECIWDAARRHDKLLV